MIKAVLFGSIGTLVETSEMQRNAFNQAFKEAGLDWDWSPQEYKNLLKKSGGQHRIERYASERGETVDAQAVHRRKTEIFDDAMIEHGVSLRPGVADVIAHAKENSRALGFVTTTSTANIDAIFDALNGAVTREDFQFIGDASMVANSKPAPDIYRHALDKMNLKPDDCIAIEDTAICMQAATDAGIPCVAFPNEYADQESFGDAEITTRLDPSALLTK